MANYMTLMVGALFALSNMDPNGPRSSDNEWISYKAQHNKTYSDQEDLARRSLFDYKKQQVEKFNANEHRFQMELNKFADRTQDEMARMNGLRMPLNKLTGELGVSANSPEAQAFLDNILSNKSDVPDELDWRKLPGRVSEVKDQGDRCGSCWAFSAVGALEGQEIKRGANGLTELSEQNLIDCVKTDSGCDGGLMTDAFNWVAKEGGIDSEKSYPYEAVDGECRFQKTTAVFNDMGAAELPKGDEQALKKVVANYGPVAVGIDASSDQIKYYTRGVFVYDECSSYKLNHGVLVVGYGTDKDAGDYWIVKNSWGKDWGEDGYIRMARNRGNMCGITTMASIPTF